MATHPGGPPPRVHIFSDGTPESTRVVGPDGKEIPNVRALRITAEAGHRGSFYVELELGPTHLDIDGPVTSIILSCPLCGTDTEHRCRMVDDRRLGD